MTHEQPARVVMPINGQLREKVGITAYSDLDNLAWLSILCITASIYKLSLKEGCHDKEN